MIIVLGATGHVGSAVTQALIDRDIPVTAVIHNTAKAADWERRGAKAAVADVHDSDALRRVFEGGTRAFLLNPPADVTLDTDAEERATAASIAAALDGSGLEKVVVESTFGAQGGDRLGDLSVLFGFEKSVLSKDISVTVQRGAYYFSNWDGQLAEARQGTLTTMLPPDLKIPMVAPVDLGEAAAARLAEPFGDTDIHLVEGPQRYSARDVAQTFAEALNRSVDIVSLPSDQWEEAYKELGFSPSAATAYARMTEATVKGVFPPPEDTEHGSTTLEAYIWALVQMA